MTIRLGTLEYVIGNVLGYAKVKENKHDNALQNPLVLPACERSELAQHLTGAFLARFHTWTATLLLGAKAELTQMGAAMAESTRVKMHAGEQRLVSKLAEFDKAVGLIGRDICVSHANLSSGQHTEENRRLEFEVKKLLLKQKTDAEAEWVDPNSKDGLSEVGLKQLSDVKKAIKDLKGVQGTLEDLQKKSKSPPPKGEKTSELKRSASAEGTPRAEEEKTSRLGRAEAFP